LAAGNVKTVTTKITKENQGHEDGTSGEFMIVEFSFGKPRQLANSNWQLATSKSKPRSSTIPDCGRQIAIGKWQQHCSLNEKLNLVS
jgi:hypothetical protein